MATSKTNTELTTKNGSTELSTTVKKSDAMAMPMKSETQLASFLEAIENVDNSELNLVSSNYMQLQFNTDYGFIVTGMSTAEFEGSTEPSDVVCAKTRSNDGTVSNVILGDAMIVSTVKREIEKGRPVPFAMKASVGQNVQGKKYKDIDVYCFD